MKKLGVIMLALLILLAGCAARETFELALVTDIGTIDDKSFNQGSWEGLYQYAVENNISHKYYQPPQQSNDAYLSTIDLAVRGGARLIVTPGFLFEVPVFIAQERYPDVKFVLVDGVPHSADYSVFYTASNTVGILYAEDQAGFLAGYAAVKDGNRRLGFVGGMAVPPVVRFGYGFVQGAEYAAQDLGLAPGSVTISYHYTGTFEARPEIQALAASWFNAGIEVIFACGGAIGNNVMAAAEQTGRKVIGVDVDQSGESPSVITSAMKGLQPSVYASIAAFYAGNFPGGQTKVFDASNDGVGLPMATSRFETFSQADYDAIFRRLANGEIPRLINLEDRGSPSIIPVRIVTVTEI
jgi:basic membrane protein A